MFNKHYFGTWFFSWLLANIIGQALGIYLAIDWALLLKIRYGQPEFILFHIIHELVLGLVQWIVIRKLARFDIWLLAIILIALTYTASPVFLFTVALSIPVLGFVMIPVAIILTGTGVGAIIGICQWFALKNKVPKSIIWIKANIIAYGIVYSISFAFFRGVPIPEIELSVMIHVLYGLIIGIITGITLEWLMEPSD